MSECRRISMWSGPRNVSTAMMYAWRQRSDTTVWDEPMYGHYLVHTGVAHAVRDEIVAAVPTDRDEVVDLLLHSACPTQVWFFKNMAHHLVGFDPDIVDYLEGFVLTRDPSEMLPSLEIGLGRVPVMADTGYDLQVGILERWAAAGRDPIVVDSRALLTDPPRVLEGLCERLGLPFEEEMLRWPSGPKPEDGVWAPHWYASVHASTGFTPYRRKAEPPPDRLQSIYAECAPLYDRLLEHAIGV